MSRAASMISIVFAAFAVILLAALHVLSPEFDPSWRVVSEYANGSFGWVLSLMFACWAISTWALAFTVKGYLQTRADKIGYWILILAGAGQALASVFDIDQPLHGLADLLGGAGFPIAAMAITITLCRAQPWLRSKRTLLWSANLTWISVVATIASVVILYITYTHAGGHVPSDGKSLPLGTVLPAGVIAVVGYANRFMVLAACAWTIIVGVHSYRNARAGGMRVARIAGTIAAATLHPSNSTNTTAKVGTSIGDMR
jgi:hypothetical protein